MQRRHWMRGALSWAVAIPAALIGFTATAQTFPTKPITMVVPFPPGGVADTVGRPVAEAMSRYLKQPIDRKSVV